MRFEVRFLVAGLHFVPGSGAVVAGVVVECAVLPEVLLKN